MRKSLFTEAQIIGMFKEQEAGMPTAETHRPKSLEDENGRLRRLLSDTMLDNAVLKDLLGKN